MSCGVGKGTHTPPAQRKLTLTWQIMQATRCDAGTAAKIQQAQVRGIVEQAAQGFVAYKVAAGAGEAELLKTGEAWARSHHSPGRLGQPHQVQ